MENLVVLKIVTEVKNILIILLLLNFLSCKSENRPVTSFNEDSLAVKTVKEFYSWYINEAYPQSSSYYQIPNYKKLSNTSYVFDWDEYKTRLNTIHFFSEDYKQKLINQLEKCNEEMIKVEWESEPEPMFNIKVCNYLWGNPWVGGQGEKISGYKIESLSSEGNAKKCVVTILINNKPFVKSIVTIKKISDENKILDININWKKD